MRKYKGEMADLAEQQTYLYATHVREVALLQKELNSLERRASNAERQHAEDAVRIESWSTMADALELAGGVGGGAADGEAVQKKVGMMGRRLTALRVRQMDLAPTVTPTSTPSPTLTPQPQTPTPGARDASGAGDVRRMNAYTHMHACMHTGTRDGSGAGDDHPKG